MKKITAGLKRKITSLKRHEHHPLIYKVHRTHKISRRTLFYMKEYGKKSHIASVILKESLFALALALLFGVLGGIGLQNVKSNFVAFLPLIILLPALNDMIGDYSMIMVSRLSTLVFTQNVARNWWASEEIRKMMRTIFSVSILSAVYIGLASSAIAYLKGFPLTFLSAAKVIEVSLITTLVMVGVVVIISAFAVFYVYKRKEDPNNIVMPIMTSLADFSTILVFAFVVRLVFTSF